MTDAQQNAQNFDALLVLSFGGPEGNEEVVPFLENVTRGRGIPRERLEVVGEHYYHFGGVSPLNALNREIIDHLEGELKNADIIYRSTLAIEIGIPLPVRLWRRCLRTGCAR